METEDLIKQNIALKLEIKQLTDDLEELQEKYSHVVKALHLSSNEIDELSFNLNFELYKKELKL